MDADHTVESQCRKKDAGQYPPTGFPFQLHKLTTLQYTQTEENKTLLTQALTSKFKNIGLFVIKVFNNKR